jgi:hypothetical protein
LANKYREKAVAQEEEVVVEETTVQEERPQRPRKKGVLAKGISSVFSGTFLTSNKTLKHLPFILFISGIAIFYIAYNYYADDNLRKENKLGKEIKEKRSEYISTTSDLMFASKQSEVAKAAEQIGLKEPIEPPTKILVDSAELYKNTNKTGK